MSKSCSANGLSFFAVLSSTYIKSYINTISAINFVRFAEWSRAAWNLQKRLLNDEDLLENHPDMRFAAIYHSDQTAEYTNCKESIMGLIMSEHWDVSEQAGSKSRGRASFGKALPSLESLAVVDGEVKIHGECYCLVFLYMDGL